MRINKFIATATGMSRRAADQAIEDGRVLVNAKPAVNGLDITDTDKVTLDGKLLTAQPETITILLNKPVGYVCSRNGQGSKTVYDLLPPEYQQLKPVGRLDKNSSGLLLLTNDGQLAYELTHPKFIKEKVYEVVLDKPLQPLHRQMISDLGIQLDDGPSKLHLERKVDEDDCHWRVRMHEGRNRQIRRTFDALGYTVEGLHRTNLGNYSLQGLASGKFIPA